MKIGIIGAGNMGGAIARGLVTSGHIAAADIRVSDKNQQTLSDIKAFNPEIDCVQSNLDCIREASLVILAVKPWFIESVANEIAHQLNYSNQMVLSIAAGIGMDQLKTFFPAQNDNAATLFRLIPNTAIDVLESFSCLTSWNATQNQENEILNLFNQMGKAMLVPESQLNAYMSLSSCGIAYAFRYIRAATEGGVEMGIYPEVAKEVVLQTLKGAVALLEQKGSHPEVEIDKVTTPGGITIKGLNAMEQSGFSAAVINGLKASHIKS